MAHKGTLFLDEIESMPASLQLKLLRVLQDFEIVRVGSTKPKKIEVRLICATNQELNELISKGLFRADLYYRLNVIPIYIPPLRERREDIPHLISFLLRHFNDKHKKKKFLTRDAIDILIQYSWPGNVRELSNLIERLMITLSGDCIDSADIPSELYPDESYRGNGTLKDQLEFTESRIVRDAVRLYGSARKAASYLGIDASTLTRKLKKYIMQFSITDAE